MITRSASQIKTFRECERKWGWRVIAGEPSTSSPAAELGKEVDDTQLQPYLKDGRPFDFTRKTESGQIAASAMEWLPEPQLPGLKVQKHFVFASAEGDWSYQGYKDLWLPDSRVLKYLPPGEGWPAVVDFKTTGDFNWALDEKGLATDVQAQLYAMNAMLETGARTVDLVWIYMRTRGARKSKMVHLRTHAPDVGAQFEAIEETAKRMNELQAASGDVPGEQYVVEALKPTPEMCSGYGGCPYRHKCNLSPKEMSGGLIQLLRKGDVMNGGIDLMASLKKRATATEPAPTLEAPAPVMGMSDKDVPAPPENVIPAAFAGSGLVGINPPEKNLPPAPPTGITQTDTSAVAQSPEPAPEPPVKAKKGRPKKDASAPAPEPTVAAIEALTSTMDLETVTVTWGAETFGGCVVGPFVASGFVREGENAADATRRISAQLHAFAVGERADKLASYARAAGKVA